MTDHLVARAADAAWIPAGGALADATGYVGWTAVGPDSPAVHTGFGLGRMEPGGRIPWHVHSYEESLYVTAGEVVVQTHGESVLLTAGDYGLIPIGELSYKRINHPSEVLSIGQKVEVVVKKLDFQAQRISLSFKQLLANPWDAFAQRHRPGFHYNQEGDEAVNCRGGQLDAERDERARQRVRHLPPYQQGS